MPLSSKPYNMATTNGASLIDTSIFTTLQSKIDDESAIRDELKQIVEALSKQGRVTQSVLSRIHNVPIQSLDQEVLQPAVRAIEEQKNSVVALNAAASKYPFYKYNGMWQRDIQNLISSIQLLHWLREGRLVTIEEVGSYLQGKLALAVRAHDLTISSTDQREKRGYLSPDY